MNDKIGSSLADQLVENYKAIKLPSSGLAWVFNSLGNTTVILRATQRQVEWIDGRDGHKSPFQEALVKLYSECPQVENVGMLQLFFDEFVQGMKPDKTQAEKDQALAAFIDSQRAWEETMGHVPHPEPELRKDAEAEMQYRKRQRDAFDSRRNSYLRAFIDYYLADVDESRTSGKSSGRQTQVHYIRDTAEQLLLTIKNMSKVPEDPLCADLEALHEISHDHVERNQRYRRRDDDAKSESFREDRERKRQRTGCGRRRDHREGDYYRPQY